MDEYTCLSAFPDVAPALHALRERFDIPLAILSNGDPPLLDIAVKSAGISSGLFDRVLSVNARAYKPAATAYELGTCAFGTTAREIVYGWDIAGAAWFGYATFWINRIAAHGRTPRYTDSAPSTIHKQEQQQVQHHTAQPSDRPKRTV